MGTSEVLYVAPPVEATAVVAALDGTQAEFDHIVADSQDRKLGLDIRPLMGVAVALRSNRRDSIDDHQSVLAIGRIGEIEDQDLAELFLLKAVTRAFDQRARGHDTDTQPMERLIWLQKGELYRAASASVSDIHVGFAGGWPHHSRLLAVRFATELAGSLALPITQASSPEIVSEAHIDAARAWLDLGQGAGDGGMAELHDARWHRARTVIDELSLVL